MNIIDVMTDPQLLGEHFSGETWANWRTVLKGFYGLPMDDDEQAFYADITKRQDDTETNFNELWLAVGRRGGKSQVAAIIAIYEAFFIDHTDKLSPGERNTCMVIASDRKQARSAFRYIKGLIDDCPMLAAMVERETNESLELTNRSVIEITTASHRRTRGYSCGLVLADEIAHWFLDGANPDHEIITALRPTLATLGGKLIAISSPYARKGVLWDAYRNYYGSDDPQILVAQAPTQKMNPSLDLSVIERAYTEDAASAAAEYGAQFRTDVESFISREAVEAVTISDRIELPPAMANHYFAFVDAAGGSGQDSMTCAIAHKDGDQIVIDAVRAVNPPFSPESVVDEFCQLFKQYRVRLVTGDRWGGDFVREQFRKRGINYQPSEKTKSELYSELLPLINSQRVQLPDIKRLFDELTGLERRTARGGKDSIDHAPKMHDDMINSVAGAIYVSNNRPVMARAPRAG